MSERFVITRQCFRAYVDGGVHPGPASSIYIEKLEEPTTEFNTYERQIDGALITVQKGELVLMKDGEIISKYPEGVAWAGGELPRELLDRKVKSIFIKRFELVKDGGED